MTDLRVARPLADDWYPGTIPDNVVFDQTAYVGTSYSFSQYRSEQPVGIRVGRAASLCDGTVLDVGPRGQVSLGEYALVTAAWIICDERVEIGDHALISWNVVLMDTYRVPFDVAARRRALEGFLRSSPPRLASLAPTRPVRIGCNVWIGFEACVLPGVTIGEGAIVGARAVVAEDVPPYTVAAGNPARVVRHLDR